MRFVATFLFCCFCYSAYAATDTVIDDSGHRVTLSAPARRIISLAPDVTESLFAIGAGKQIAGVMKGSDYPALALQLPIVGSYSGLDLERIILLHPDLVIVWGNGFARQLAVLQKMHIPVYVTQPRQLQDIPATLRRLGVLTGHVEQANQQADVFERKIEQLRKRYQHQQPVTVFYQLGAFSLMTINHESWINQVITLCGGRNVFAHAVTAAPEVSWESILAANPDVIINDSANTPGWQIPWQRWTAISAVAHHRLYAVHSDWIDRAGPRLVEGAAEVCGYLARSS